MPCAMAQAVHVFRAVLIFPTLISPEKQEKKRKVRSYLSIVSKDNWENRTHIFEKSGGLPR